MSRASDPSPSSGTSTGASAAVVVRLVAASKSYRRGAETIFAVRDATLDLTPGSVTVISGPSGSGKTTLLNLILGWEALDHGRREPETLATDWSSTAVIPQRLGLLDHCTIAENVSLPGRATDLVLDPRDVMRRLAIDHLADRFPTETSLGEQQRAAVARALVSQPRLLIADEPTSHQDDTNTHRICELLVDAAGRGSCVVVATHDQRVAAHAHRHLHLTDGRLATGRAELA